jgi:ribosome biogenesis GTPase
VSRAAVKKAPVEAIESALVLTTHSRILTVRHGENELQVTLAGRMQKDGGAAPVAGDRVRVVKAGEEWRVAGLLPRTTRMMRGDEENRKPQVLAANADLAVVILAPQPLLDFNWAERLLLGARVGGLETLLLINKSDLLEDEDLLDRADYLKAIGQDWLLTSARTGTGLEALHARLEGRTACLLGHSGVGKSSLLNVLLPGTEAKTGTINRIGYGSHATSAAQFHAGPLFNLIDLAGLREFSLSGLLRASELPEYFPELTEARHRCRFRDCAHASEPGCAVRAVLETLDPRRQSLFEQFQKELLG